MDRESQDLLRQAARIDRETSFEVLFSTYNKLMSHRWHCSSCGATAMLLIVGDLDDAVLGAISRGDCPDPRRASGWARKVTAAASARLIELSGSVVDELLRRFPSPEDLVAAFVDVEEEPELDPLDIN